MPLRKLWLTAMAASLAAAPLGLAIAADVPEPGDTPDVAGPVGTDLDQSDVNDVQDVSDIGGLDVAEDVQGGIDLDNIQDNSQG